MAEVDLYLPVKRYLEGQGYEVKGEIGRCDIMAIRGEEPPVIVELKERLTLSLLLQGVDRLRISETVYLAFRIGKGRSATWRTNRRQVLALMRRLGLGLLTVSERNRVIAVLDPAPYRPRINKHLKARLLKEFAERTGDPETGGAPARKRLTAYRQDALRCVALLAEHEVLKVSELRERTGVQRVGTILIDNHYGWFDRVRRGHYSLSAKGRNALREWTTAIESLRD